MSFAVLNFTFLLVVKMIIFAPESELGVTFDASDDQSVCYRYCCRCS